MKTGNIILVALLSFSTATLWAQKEKKKPVAKSGKEKVAVATASKTISGPVPVYLGHSDFKGGNLPKKKFDSLLRQGLIAKDSLGNLYKINGFNFNYAERNLYEDSAGQLMMMTDYALEYCIGDTVSPSIKDVIYSHSKSGDTVFIDHVTVTRPDSTAGTGRGMKIVITK